MKKQIAKVARIINCYDVPGKRPYDRDIHTALSCGAKLEEIVNSHNQKVNSDSDKKEDDKNG